MAAEDKTKSYLTLTNNSGWSDYTSIDESLIRQIAKRPPEPLPRPTKDTKDTKKMLVISNTDTSRKYKLIIIVLGALLLVAVFIAVCAIFSRDRSSVGAFSDLTQHIKGCNSSDSGSTCQGVYDGSDKSGPNQEWGIRLRNGITSWIQLNLYEAHIIKRVRLLPRCVQRQQISTVKLYFQNHQEVQEINLQCVLHEYEDCDSIQWQMFDIKPVASQFIRLEITELCYHNFAENSGLRELQIWGH